MWSQSVDVARWVRPAIEHAQDILSGGLDQEGEYDFVLVFKGSCFVLIFCYIIFCFPFVSLVVSFSQKSNCFWFGFVLRLFGVFCFFFRLGNSLQKNKLSKFQAGLIRFGYRGFSFLIHAVSLWFMVFSKLRWLLFLFV